MEETLKAKTTEKCTWPRHFGTLSYLLNPRDHTNPLSQTSREFVDARHLEDLFRSSRLGPSDVFRLNTHLESRKSVVVCKATNH